MSETLGEERAAAVTAPTPARGEPRPEEIRFFGTTWVAHNGGYAWRRAGVAVGSLLATAVGALVLRFGFQGLADADIGPFVTFLAVAGFAVCSALAFQRTWQSFSRRRPPAADADAARSAQGLVAVGFLGILLAYFVRSLSEAPGEALCRAEYEAALSAHARKKPKRKRR
ncbi:hypothetical protein ABZ901_33405 [Actinacidiphila alni]|uniref:hypothetical protein n=1 Tax=Actinacidiphila alni TaxID=380248 RepID=UPI0034089FFF